MSKALKFADEAIFVLQLDSKEAVKYIQRNAKCDEVTAITAFKTAVLPSTA